MNSTFSAGCGYQSGSSSDDFPVGGSGRRLSEIALPDELQEIMAKLAMGIIRRNTEVLTPVAFRFLCESAAGRLNNRH